MPNNRVIGVLTDIGTEELGHEEMVSTIVTQLTKNLTMKEIENSVFYQYYVNHTVDIDGGDYFGENFGAKEWITVIHF